MRPRRPRLSWKCGPAAWKVAARADEILETLTGSPRRFFSLRAAARLFISMQPLRDRVERGDLNRAGPRLQFSRDELHRFVKQLAARAEPYDWRLHIDRFHRHLKRPPRPFEKLRSARFAWPRANVAHPKGAFEFYPLSSFIGCQSHTRELETWPQAHADAGKSLEELGVTPSFLPSSQNHGCHHCHTATRFPLAEVANHLQTCGLDGVDQLGVRKLIKEGCLRGCIAVRGG